MATITGNGNGNILGGTSSPDTIYGRAGNDYIEGNGGGDSLFGEIGNDILRGDAGSDTLNGGAGSDILNGGTGPDNLIGGSGADEFRFGQNFGSDLVADFNKLQGDRIAIEIPGVNSLSDIVFDNTGFGCTATFGGAQIRFQGVGANYLNDADLWLFG